VFCFIGWLTHISHWEILLLVIVIQILTSLLIFCRNIITANQYFGIDAWLSVIDKMLMIIFCGSILYSSFFGKISLLLFLQIQTACTALAVSVSFFLILKKKLITTEEKQNIDRIIKQVLPFALIILLMSIHYRLDGFLLERIHTNGALEAGIYASAYRLLDASNMVGYLASSFLVAFVARNLAEKQTLEDAIFNTRHLLMFCSLGVASFAFVFAPWIETLLYHSNSRYNAFVIQLCIASFPAYCLVHVYGSVLTGAAKFKQFITVLISSVVLNIILNSILIPAQGAVGCCIAALVSQYFCGAATLAIATRTVNISYHGKSLLIYILFATLLTVFFYFGKNVFVNVWLILAIAVFVSLLFLFTQLSVFKKYFISLR
jgi:O-antigen/teichoic acid export membrane protein